MFCVVGSRAECSTTDKLPQGIEFGPTALTVAVRAGLDIALKAGDQPAGCIVFLVLPVRPAHEAATAAGAHLHQLVLGRHLKESLEALHEKQGEHALNRPADAGSA